MSGYVRINIAQWLPLLITNSGYSSSRAEREGVETKHTCRLRTREENNSVLGSKLALCAFLAPRYVHEESHKKCDGETSKKLGGKETSPFPFSCGQIFSLSSLLSRSSLKRRA